MKIREVLGRDIRALRRQSLKIHESAQVLESVMSVPINWAGAFRSYSTNITVLKNPSEGELRGFAYHVIAQDEKDGEPFHAIRGLSVAQPNGEVDRFYWNGRYLHDHVKLALISHNKIPGPDANGQLPIMRHHLWEMFHGRVSEDSLAHLYAGATQSPERQQVLDKLAKDYLLNDSRLRMTRNYY